MVWVSTLLHIRLSKATYCTFSLFPPPFPLPFRPSTPIWFDLIWSDLICWLSTLTLILTLTLTLFPLGGTPDTMVCFSWFLGLLGCSWLLVCLFARLFDCFVCFLACISACCTTDSTLLCSTLLCSTRKGNGPTWWSRKGYKYCRRLFPCKKIIYIYILLLLSVLAFYNLIWLDRALKLQGTLLPASTTQRQRRPK